MSSDKEDINSSADVCASIHLWQMLPEIESNLKIHTVRDGTVTENDTHFKIQRLYDLFGEIDAEIESVCFLFTQTDKKLINTSNDVFTAVLLEKTFVSQIQQMQRGKLCCEQALEKISKDLPFNCVYCGGKDRNCSINGLQKKAAEQKRSQFKAQYEYTLQRLQCIIFYIRYCINEANTDAVNNETMEMDTESDTPLPPKKRKSFRPDIDSKKFHFSG